VGTRESAMKDPLLVDFAATVTRLAELTEQMYDRENARCPSGQCSSHNEAMLVGARLTLLESMMLDLVNAQWMVRNWS